MSKSKNHTNANQNYKAHRNGITRPKKHELLPTRGMSLDGRRKLTEEHKAMYPVPKSSMTFEERYAKENENPRTKRKRMIFKIGVAKMARGGVYLN